MSRQASGRRLEPAQGDSQHPVRRVVRAGGRPRDWWRTHRARADRASVLDGTTLRVAGRLWSPAPAPAGGTPTIELWLRRRPPGTAVLRLCAADVEQRSWAGPAFEASAPLAVGGRSLIGQGDWDVYLRVASSGLLAVRAPRPERDTGPTLANPRSAETGLWYRLGTTSSGQLSIHVLAFRAHAEVVAVRPYLTELVIEGRVVGTRLKPDGTAGGSPLRLEFSEAGTGAVLCVPARLERDRFRVEVDPEPFTASDAGPRTWYPSLRAAGREPLVLGRYLDDMRRPGAVYRYPSILVGSGPAQATRLQVTYDDDRRLLLRCAPAVGGDPGP